MFDIQDDLIKRMNDEVFASERAARHASAIHASDVEELRRNLREAAWRFNDLANLIEHDGVNARNHTGFMRASAERFSRAAGCGAIKFTDGAEPAKV